MKPTAMKTRNRVTPSTIEITYSYSKFLYPNIVPMSDYQTVKTGVVLKFVCPSHFLLTYKRFVLSYSSIFGLSMNVRHD